MALLWCDGFDHYGSDRTNLLDNVYADVGNDGLSTTQFNTGTHSWAVSSITGLSNWEGLRKSLPTAVNKLGVCARFYFPTLPSGSGAARIFHFLPPGSTDHSQLSFIVGPNGEIQIYRLGNTHATSGYTSVLIGTTDPLIGASGWNHIEIQAYIHDTLGWVRIAVNGVHKYSLTGVDTRANATFDTVAGIGHNREYGATSDSVFYMDDYYVYDFTGTAAVDTDFCPTVDGSGIATNYIGELQVMYLPVNGDTAEADWTKSSGTDGYALLDEVDPNDADYVSSTVAGDLSEYALTDLPEDITYVRGLMMIGRMSKADSGAAMIKYGMKSVAATADSAEFPITTLPSYWWKFQNTDPNSSSRWTRASLNAAWLRLQRTV